MPNSLHVTVTESHSTCTLPFAGFMQSLKMHSMSLSGACLWCRLLDDNRELYVPELGEMVKPHPHFMLFATQNPAGAYGGRKVLFIFFEPFPKADIITTRQRLHAGSSDSVSKKTHAQQASAAGGYESCRQGSYDDSLCHAKCAADRIKQTWQIVGRAMVWQAPF